MTEPITGRSLSPEPTPSDERVSSPLAPLGAISRAVNEAIGRSVLGDPVLRDLLIGIGNALDDVINDMEEVPDDV